MTLSVLMITYNQERYVAQALDSILMQQVDFPYEIVIGDDCSTDGTRSILELYQRRFPDLIRLLPPEKNLGPVRNLLRVFAACRGQFVAMLEGDDYWTCPEKLQEQVDFLRRNHQFVICFTNSLVVDEEGATIRPSRLEADRSRNLSQADIINGLVPPTNTVVFRNGLVRSFPRSFYRCVNGDSLLFSVLTEYGDAAFIDRHTAAYRSHAGGIWSYKPEAYQKLNTLLTRQALLHRFGTRYRAVLLPEIQWSYRELMELYKDEKKVGKFAGTFSNYLFNNARCGVFNLRDDLRYFVFGVAAALRR
ncbi:glycosyltransferase [Geomonas paludis]|uniref:Glycosyltransferase n=1 Tax=Geomonas paludis TaxID=2740185 RepID=A0A6V8MW06_9BACT|nr:glycosyltransferase [Geomonas paludis]UPU34381.1 glycosyltransferase [Geomonas paludis]GFO64366.1 hypothetical protein GMPD_22850 [Geomonas paludis]